MYGIFPNNILSHKSTELERFVFVLFPTESGGITISTDYRGSYNGYSTFIHENLIDVISSVSTIVC